MRGKTPRPDHGGDTAFAPPRWPFFSGTRAPPHFLPNVATRGLAADSPDNIRACTRRRGSLPPSLRNGRPLRRASFCCAFLAGAATCRPDIHSDSLPAERRTHLGAAGWERSSPWTHLPV